MNLLKPLFSVFLLISLSACASHYGAARIISTPPGAEVVNLDDGTIIGVTPLTYWWKDGSANRQHIPVRLKKAGYYEKVSSFWLSMRHSSQSAASENPDLVEIALQKKGE